MTHRTDPIPDAHDEGKFLEKGRAAVHSVRRALAEVLESVGGDPAKPQDLARRFGLDKMLTWRIARVVRDADAWDAVPHIPRRPSVRTLIKSMARAGAPQEKLDSVQRALDDFEDFVRTHSDDRETFEAMIGTRSRRSSEKRMETFRKNAFQASSAIWGVRARTQLGVNIMAPGSQPEMLDIATVSGMFELRRLRRDVPWAVASAISWDFATPGAPGSPTALHADGAIDGVPILPQFCSTPIPHLRRVGAPGGNTRFEVFGDAVGNTSAATVVLGWIWKDTASVRESRPDEPGEHGVNLFTPVEVAYQDLLIHRSLTFAMNPTAHLYSRMPGGPEYPNEGTDVGILPVPDDVIDLGAGPPDTTTSEIPHYHELVEFAVGRMGWKLADFHAFRFRLRYPPIPTLALLKHRLLPR